MLLTIYTMVHVLISLAAIFSGFGVMLKWLCGKRSEGVETFFLWTTIATSVTGFFFPFHGFKPSYVVGILSLVVLTLAIQARHRLTGGWRLTYVISAVVAFYFNVFVLIVQSFLKVPALYALAPTQTEPLFKIAQLMVLVLFVILGFVAARKFRVA